MIYFIVAGCKYVKIGYSCNPHDRLKELQTGNPHKLKLIATIPGLYNTEKELHSVFSPFKMEGEWFRYTGSLKDCVLSINDPGRKHHNITTVKQLLENGMHLQIRQKANRNKNFKKKFNKILKK